MKRLFIFALIAFAAWYGWKHYPQLLDRRPKHEAVIVNSTGHPLQRVRVSVGGQTFVKESLPEDQKAVFPFSVNSDASFELRWQYVDKLGELSWKGGMVPRGPMVQRHIMTIDPDGQVIYQPQNK